MVNRTLCLTLSLVAAIAAGAVLAAEQPAKKAESEKRGYWWYQDPPKVEEAPPAKPSEPKATTPPEKAEPEFADLGPPPSEAELLKMHPKQVEKLIEEYRQYALWKTTPQNVTWYYELQDHARRRSRSFMNVTQMVMLENPQLNMNTTNPTSPPGIQAKTAQRETETAQRLGVERDQAAIILLSRASCGMCQAQRGVLRYFQQKHGWEVRELDMDRNPSLAARFSTDFTPTTIVIFRNSKDWMPVAVGVETLPKVEENVYRAIRLMRKETTPQQFTMQSIHKGSVLDPVKESP